MAGGVALNCVANGKILKENIFENIWIQPASGDAGGSLGAALGFYFEHLNKERKLNDKNMDLMKNTYLGPKFENSKIEKDLKQLNAKYDYFNDENLTDFIAQKLSIGKVVGWFGKNGVWAKSTWK